jgi:hypothetical protein
MSEYSHERLRALKIADIVLERPYADPDDDLAILARQLKRAQEEIEVFRTDEWIQSGQFSSLL